MSNRTRPAETDVNRNPMIKPASRPIEPPRKPGEEGSAARVAAWTGILLGLLAAGLFYYPERAWPLRNLALCGGVLAVGVAGSVLLVVAGRPDAWARFRTTMGRWPVLAAGLFTMVLFLRWQTMQIEFAGRETVLGWLWLMVAVGTGGVVGAWDSACEDPTVASRWLRRTLAVATIGFGLMAVYQVFVAYPRTLAYLQSRATAPADALQRQSLIHALSERRAMGRLTVNLFAAQMAVGAVFGLSVVGRKSWGWTLTGLVAVAAALNGVLLTASRGGMLTLLVAGTAAAGGFWLTRRRRTVERVAAAGAGVVLALAVLQGDHALAAGYQGLLERLTRIDTVRERFHYWTIALRLWGEHPWVGAGPGGFEIFYPTLKPAVARESQYVHNWVLAAGAGTGLLGLACLGAFWGGLLGVLGRAVRDARRGDHLASSVFWLVLPCLVLAVNGLFEFSLQWRVFLMLVGLLTGLALAQQGRPGKPNGRADNVRGAAGMIMTVLAAGLAAGLVVPCQMARHHHHAGEQWSQQKRWDRAIESFRAAARWAPDHPRYWVSLAGAYSLSGQPAQAWPLLKRAEALNPRSASVRAAQASWLDQAGRLEAAIEKMGEAIERYPSRVEYRLRRARMRLDAGRSIAARADLNYIERHRLLIYQYQREPYNALRRRAGLKPVQLPRPPEAETETGGSAWGGDGLPGVGR